VGGGGERQGDKEKERQRDRREIMAGDNPRRKSTSTVYWCAFARDMCWCMCHRGGQVKVSKNVQLISKYVLYNFITLPPPARQHHDASHHLRRSFRLI